MSTLSEELTLPEQLLLLSLDDRGKIKTPKLTQVGLVSAAMLELALRKKVQINKYQSIVLIDKKTDNEYLKKVMDLFFNENRMSKGLSAYISKYGRGSNKNFLKQMTFESLVDKGICTEGKGVYPVQDSARKEELKKEINQAIDSDENTDPKRAILIKLVKKCELTNAIYKSTNNKDLATAKGKISEMLIDFDQLPMDVGPNIKSLLETTSKTYRDMDSRMDIFSGFWLAGAFSGR